MCTPQKHCKLWGKEKEHIQTGNNLVLHILCVENFSVGWFMMVRGHLGFPFVRKLDPLTAGKKLTRSWHPPENLETPHLLPLMLPLGKLNFNKNINSQSGEKTIETNVFFHCVYSAMLTLKPAFRF